MKRFIVIVTLALLVSLCVMLPVFAADAALAAELPETGAAARTADVGIVLGILSLVSCGTIIGIRRKHRKP